MFSKNEFIQRRQQLMGKLGKNAIAIIASAPEAIRNGDGHYLYRQDSDFYYLTGFSEPEAIAVLIPGRSEGEFILFNRKRDPAQEVWTGRRAGQVGAKETYAADEAYPIDTFAAKLPEFLLGCERIGYCIGRHPHLDEQLLNTINALHSKVRMGIVVPREFMNLEQFLHPMRQVKSATELDCMRKAASISCRAHERAMEICKPGLFEYQLEAELIHEFYRNGSRAPAYNSIVAAGENACILHYEENNALIKDGDLILIDAGCEYSNYSSDITRTFPANGRFSPAQKAIYELVLKAQLACIAKVKPGETLDNIHQTTLQILTEGLVELGLLKGTVDELLEQKAYFPFYMHRTSHWLGLDTHDAGLYKKNGEWIKLAPGMVITIEPGLYIAPDNQTVDEKWRGIGVRIEDDVLVTEAGCEVLTAAVPKTVAEIEALVGRTAHVNASI
jgi:Xaa-Pro aminopeptidase